MVVGVAPIFALIRIFNKFLYKGKIFILGGGGGDGKQVGHSKFLRGGGGLPNFEGLQKKCLIRKFISL